jgi:ribonuclease HI
MEGTTFCKEHIEFLNRFPNGLVVYTDGACHPNPYGKAGYGYVVYNRLGKVKESFDGDDNLQENSNNTAEAKAFILFFNENQDLIGHKILFLSDSQLTAIALVRKIPSNGICHERSREAIRLSIPFDGFYMWISRDFNTEADKMSNKGMEKVGHVYSTDKTYPKKKAKDNQAKSGYILKNPGPKERFTRGKHKGIEFHWVEVNHSDYITWLEGNVENWQLVMFG